MSKKRPKNVLWQFKYKHLKIVLFLNIKLLIVCRRGKLQASSHMMCFLLDTGHIVWTVFEDRIQADIYYLSVSPSFTVPQLTWLDPNLS